MDEAISFIEKSGAKVVLMKEIPRAKYDYLNCFYTRFKNRIFHQEKDIDNCNFDINETNKGINNTLWVAEMFQKIQIKYPSVVIINPADLLCHGGKCLGNIKGVPTYRDDGHLTDYASYQLGVKYAKEIGDPFQ
ncbi:SGNH hydrolase domain-containing protein [Arsenophonus sp. PmNCSU2021_1]|uniref:SGNH hydrolase domain-containing protein n=1 Tax=Arsenophonus sp. PmNCSU2021_1 TaxID=3118989 RepID=UPI002FF11B97